MNPFAGAKHPMKLRDKLIISLCCCALIPFMLLLTITISNMVSVSDYALEDFAMRLANQTALALEAGIGEIDSLLLSSYYDPALYTHMTLVFDDTFQYYTTEATKGLLNTYRALPLKSTAEVYYFDRQLCMSISGKETVSPSFAVPSPWDGVNEPWVTKCINNKGTLTIIAQPDESPPRLKLARCYMNLQDRPIGILAITIPTSSFFDQLLYIDVPGSTHFVRVTDAEGTVLYTHNPHDELPEIVKSHPNKFGWTVEVGVNSSAIPAAIVNALLTIISGGVILLILILIYIILFSRRTSRSMIELIQGMKSASTGDLSHPVRITSSTFAELETAQSQFNKMLLRLDEHVKREYQLKLHMTQAQLEMLQSKINPHMLFNTLTTIYSEAVDYGADSVCEMIRELADMLRYSLYKPAASVSLFEEICHVENYLELQMKRFENMLHYEIQCDDVLYDLPAMKLSLQPIVENSFKHGFVNASPMRLRITVEKTGCSICVVISDNGVGASKERVAQINAHLEKVSGTEEFRSMGLKNVHTRIQLAFPGSSGVQLLTGENGGITTRLSWQLPFLPAQKESEEPYEVENSGG